MRLLTVLKQINAIVIMIFVIILITVEINGTLANVCQLHTSTHLHESSFG